ncbi:MAG: DUF4876 domain-containing protein [Prevotella sp.]|nr:DUF4876 domain-containing protein [Candidatus Prevotella equi]
MKKVLYLIILYILTACTYDEHLELMDVAVQLTSSEVSQGMLSNIPVTMVDGNSTATTSQTDEQGIAYFRLPVGVYNVSMSVVKDDEDFRYIMNGNIPQYVVTSTTKSALGAAPISLPFVVSTIDLHPTSDSPNGLIIKEIYSGGCQKNDGSGTFSNDKCIILYNNTNKEKILSNLAFGICEPYNAEAGGHNFLNGGVLEYENTGIMPALNGIWYFQDELHVPAYSEVVVNVHGAIDNTITYVNSINYANAAYYCMYDPVSTSNDGKSYNNTSYYPAPAEVIPSSHYLKTVKFGSGTAWAFSQTSPAVFLFQTKNVTPKEYAENIDNIIYPSIRQGNMAYACLSVPREWIIDGVEVYNGNKLSDCKKRLTPDIDNGYVTLYGGHGHSVIRKIDEETTAKTGHAVYIDTNNSSNDFVEAEKCSLK